MERSELQKRIKRLAFRLRAGFRGRQIRSILKKRMKGSDIEPGRTVYYIINVTSAITGLFSYVNLCLPQIDIAIRAGMTPVVDMQNHKTPYLEASQVGRVNAWEFYFEQPEGIGLDRALQDNCRLEADHRLTYMGPYAGAAFYDDRYGEKTYWRAVAHRYLRVDEKIRKKAEDWYAEKTSGRRVLGVLCRGTDYLALKPGGHPIQPEPNEMLSKAQELMRDWDMPLIYLCTEDKRILDLFKKTVGDGLLYFEREYVGDTGTDYVTAYHFDRADDARLQGEEYLLQILILSKCTGLLAGSCGGTVGAELLTDGYEREYVWDLGSYGSI